ncbi:hypothetical protein BDQ17DRAFT_1395959 [Cyathus striatus]|nr:hypothetical protein BDQ17DRAFT_1395959 [Cyathus striatus]
MPDSALHDATPRASHLSPEPPAAALSPTWRPPKSPLAPDRLAKLANALGVSTPIPTVHAPNSFLSRSYSESSNPDRYRRSPTPSTTVSTNFSTYAPTPSKYLLMSSPLSTSLTNPTPSMIQNSSSTTRCVRVPYSVSTWDTCSSAPTFHAQLGAIAKEYALPSTSGLVLYLVSNAKIIRGSDSGLAVIDDQADELGPRLSEEIWKHLWTRIMKTEQRDENVLLLSRSATPNPANFDGAGNGRLSPFPPSPVTEIPIHPQPPHSITPSPSSPSSSKSAPPSSHSDPDTPDTSVEDRANSFDLPGLLSPSVIPILAKVEFIVDRRRAPWFDPWLKSRKANHAKRAGSRLGKRTQTASPASFALPPADDLSDQGESEDIIEQEEMESNTIGYEQLSESIDEGHESEENHDPLSDVFGTDADTWTDMHASEEQLKHESNPNIVPLAFTGAEISALPDPENLEEDDDSRIAGKEEDEVKELLEQMSKPSLSISIPGSPSNSNKRSSSPVRKHVPPPLVLVPKSNASDLVIPTEPTPISSGNDSIQLAYLSGSPDDPDKVPSPVDEVHEEELDRYTRVRSPEESEKRVGGLFEDLDLGLDPSEDFDDDDPNDRRRSQYLMKAQLDEIERTMAQLSPRILKADLEEEPNQSFQSMSLSPNGSSHLSLSPMRNGDIFPPSPRLPHHLDEDEPSGSNPGASWPAVPFSAIKDVSGSSTSPDRTDGPPSPPRLALNGVTTSAPKSYMPTRTSTNEVSAETVRRKRELEEEHALYPPLHSPGSKDATASDSPIIPLSPDPFGRYPSTPTPDVEDDSRASTASNWDIVTVGRGLQSFPNEEEKVVPAPAPITRERSQSSATTSRFSADSIGGDDPTQPTPKPSNRTTLMSVKSIRKLWRRSKDKNSVSLATPSVGLPTGRTSPQVPQRPERPSQENMDLPDIPDMPPPPTPTYGRFSPQPPAQNGQRLSHDRPVPVPQGQLLGGPFGGKASVPMPIIAAQMLPGRSAATLDRLQFDQESPYPNPIRRYSPVPKPPSPTQATSLPEKEKDKTTTRKSILKSWKSSSSGSISHTVVAEAPPRSSFERANSGASRGRRPSVINFGSSRSSVTSPDIPPSPQIPEYFMGFKGSHDHRQSKASRSMASSRDSIGSRPSFDVSQFEIVSPKAGALTYPYHGLDNES